jgi:thioredoxin 2
MSTGEIVVCPHCLAGNRIARDRLGDGPKCGRCRRALFSGHSVEADPASFAAHVGKGTLPVLVDFWAPWCGPCRMMAPAYEQAAGQLEPFVRVLKVDTERHQALAGAHGIRSIPTLMLLQGGRESRRVAGAMDALRILDWARYGT